MKILIAIGFFLELVIFLPAFIVCLLLFFTHKNQALAGRRVDRFLKFKRHWLFSFAVWLTLYLLIR